jgi:hypothetical protein
MSLRVFAQHREPTLDAAGWRRAAKQFFGVELVVTGDAVTIAGGTRKVAARMREERDLRDALRVDGGAGLYDLAERRCPTVWIIDCDSPDDSVALEIAAILATVGLGPILSDPPSELFGVRTARLKLGA